MNGEFNNPSKSFNTIGVFNEFYFNINLTTLNAIKFFTKQYAVRYYYESIKSEPFLRDIYVKYNADINTIMFWTIIDPDDFESRDKVFDYELELRKKFKDKDINFEFKILLDTEYFLNQIPANTKNVIK